jgi:hypothetical protein
VIYSYGTVKFSDEFGMPKLNFNYNIIHSGNHNKEVLQNDQDFVIIMGDILTDIIINNEPTRNNDPQEPDLY